MSDGWSFDGSILTFAFPMLLFIGVAVGLYVLYTKPAAVPGHRASTAERPVSYTPMPGTATAAEVPGSPQAAPGSPQAAPGSPAADGAATAADGVTESPEAPE